MSDFEVSDPILNSPYEEPREHWWIEEGSAPQRREGRRPAMYFYREPKPRAEVQGRQGAEAIPLQLVNQIRDLVATWRHQGCPGASRTTHELLSWWRREGREKRLFFAQVEAAETIIFLREARGDFLQGVEIPRDEPSAEQKAEGYAGFLRYACKLATGSGKTTVMGMLAAWSILNKVNDRGDARFSDVVLVVCPNVTIRSRLAELDPELGEASLYRTRDLVPPHLMKFLRQGRVVITNWHVFEPQTANVGGQGGRVLKAGQPVVTKEKILVGEKNTTARGKRYLTLSTLELLAASGQLEVLAGSEERDAAGNLVSVEVRTTRYVESDTAVVARVLGREVGGKQNILVMNDEAHHAYRIKRDEPDADEDDEEFGEDEEAEEFYKEATVWVEGLDRVQKLRGINFCVDLSATPYFLGRVGQDANRPFPWVVSDFGLIDAIESGLVKIPQLAIRDTTGGAIIGAEDKIPSYFNIWHWILPKLTPAERGGKRANPKPEAILKYAHTPIAMLAGLWEETAREWTAGGSEPRPPVFILICKNTALAKVIHEWIADDVCPTGIPPLRVEGFRNRDGALNTIRVDSKVVQETDTGGAKGDANRWMRFTLDTVGRLAWPRDRQGREIFPEGFEELAKKLEKPLHPPGRDVRCIVSVGMLTEGWDCNTVTHIVGLRPFMSQLLCEQVVGRGLRRASYEIGDDGKLPEEVAKVFGVPFEVVPFKANKGGAPLPPAKRIHVRAVAEKAAYEITFPRVEGYTQAIRNRVAVDWSGVPALVVDPTNIPPEVEMKGLHVSNTGRQTLEGPGRIDDVSLREFRSRHRLQELAFDLAKELTKSYLAQPGCTVPAQVLFPQCCRIVQRYVETKVEAKAPADVKDIFLAPYYGWLVERLTQAIRPDTAAGEAPEVPRYETSRGPGSTADVSFFTSREVREGRKCHLNFAVLDTGKWEQSAVYFIDTHSAVEAFVKNAGLGFAVPYFHNGEPHDYVPDFIVRLNKPEPLNLIVETKGYDPLQEVKGDAARRWCAAVNSDGRHGRWRYALCKGPLEVKTLLDGILLGNA